MDRYARICFSGLCVVLLVASYAMAKPMREPIRVGITDMTDVDIVGDAGDDASAPRKVLQDTVWIAEWSYDAGASCDDTGWLRVDNRIVNDGTVYWSVTSEHNGIGAVSGEAAALGYDSDVCCATLNGYANLWYQGIRIEYSGSGTLSFDYLIDSESGFDFVQIETDSACSSYDRVDFDVAPSGSSVDLRTVEFMNSGLDLAASVSDHALTDFGTNETHCVYVSFISDFAASPCDGLQPTQIGAALVVDNISLTDGSGTRSEDFAGGVLDMSGASFVNMDEVTPFGSWARLFKHVTDNDVCTENTTCAWLWTDDVTPSIANDPSMAFAPGSFVVKNWLDDIIVSPWVSLASTPTATGTVIEFSRFPGNFFSQSRIVQNWSVRGRTNVGGTECISDWGNAFNFQALSVFSWITQACDMSPSFDPTSTHIQIRHRTSDWQLLVGATPPPMFAPGPGPFIDRTRIGRQVLSGPVISEGIDARSQGQDAFPTEIDPTITPGTGEHFRPLTDRFGTAAFSQGSELGINNISPNLITGDSVWVQVQDVRGAGGVAAVELHGAIVSGVHEGKAPPPHVVGANGFFVVTADSVRNVLGSVVADNFFVDLDDDYFRGGDVLHYVWLARDGLGGVSSDPAGLAGVPASIEEAQSATLGLLEVSFLPTIDWDASYLARVAADESGKLEPTEDELAASSQRNCILYYNQTNFRKQGGDFNRSSFMFTLDALGYRGHYDTYFHSGIGNTNNQLGGRATVEQAQGYNLIVYDAGNQGVSFLLPDGSDLDVQKVDQASWFRNWLSQAALSEAGFATLWILGSNVAEAKPINPLLTADMGVVLNQTDQGLNANPDIEGVASFTFAAGGGSNNVDFGGEEFSLSGGCPVVRDYDGLVASGSAVVTHSYRDPNDGNLGTAAVVMRSNPAEQWNTVFQSHPWFDIRLRPGTTPSTPEPEAELLSKILGAALPPECLQEINPTDTGERPVVDAVPRRTVLYQNSPNPFNPLTEIAFDLARSGHVKLRVYDVTGRLVRSLIDAKLSAQANHRVVWDGLDDSGNRVSSGVFFYRLDAPNFAGTHKMVVLK